MPNGEPTQCRSCSSTNLANREKPPHIELYCVDCGAHQKFVSREKQPDKRPKLARGTLDEVWAEADNYCAHCGIHADILKILGVERTVQHVPPFAVNGHEGYLIPLCGWCQQSSAAQMKRLTALVSRLSEHFKIRD